MIAGSGEFPFHVCREAGKRGYTCVVAAVRDQAPEKIQDLAGAVAWFEAHEASSLISFFKTHGVREAVFAGKIDPRVVFRSPVAEAQVRSLLEESQNRGPSALIQAVIALFVRNGIAIVDPSGFLTSTFCNPGVLTRDHPTPEMEEDILFGWACARKLADMDIGQTVVVKQNTVVAVEGIEGTDEAILRAGKLAGKGVVAVKVCRSHQDPRIDLPAVGLDTVKSIIEAGGRALCFEALKMPFFQKEEAVSLANTLGIVIVAREDEKNRGDAPKKYV